MLRCQCSHIKHLIEIIIVSFLAFSSFSIYASEYSVYKNALQNLREERSFYKLNYTEEILLKLDEKAYRGKTYSRYLRLLYSAMDEVEAILGHRLINSDDTQSDQYRGVVFLDAGHGGTDPGATVPPFMADRPEMLLAESDITFEISGILKDQLAKNGYLVILSREHISEGYSLFVRSVLCRAIRPDIAVSVHLNSSQYAYPVFDRADTALPELNYTRVYVWAPAPEDLLYPFYKEMHKRILESNTRQQSLTLADSIANELRTELQLDFTLPPDLQVKLAQIKELRKQLSEQLVAIKTPTYPRELYEDIIPEDILRENIDISSSYKLDIQSFPGVEGADLHLVREMPQIPSVLVEPIFISCPQEQSLLLNDQRKQQIATGIFKGIIAYFEKKENGTVTYYSVGD
ncbi:MAG: N-acetylmuramoyl-L-alanine amidase [Candidatus Auribacterota bacterium]|nr:N-acetylmuramoyl-L-alanine amidase [Candidatus Auribacterota bacterium]